MDYASIDEMREWAESVIFGREPDKQIGGPENPYLQRWHIIPRNIGANAYLHRMLRSDDDRALHDHPWQNVSQIISGCYLEHTPDEIYLRQPGDIIERPAVAAHRLELIDSAPVISLFTTGPKVREWGFHCPHGWRHWRDFTSGPHGETIGRGCD